MFDLVRLVYASKATFKPVVGGTFDKVDLQPEIAAILQTARSHNKAKNIGGVLYFANGFFFQCLEGKRRHVTDLVDKIEQDGRHQNMKVSYYRRARRRRFNEWSMKFVPQDPQIMQMVSERGYTSFNPVMFDESDINSLVDLFTKIEDTSLNQEELRRASRLQPSLLRRLLGRSQVHSF